MLSLPWHSLTGREERAGVMCGTFRVCGKSQIDPSSGTMGARTRTDPTAGQDFPGYTQVGLLQAALGARDPSLIPGSDTPSPVPGRMERDAQFAQRKAERATLRSHFRDKYRLPKNETDESQIQMVGGDVELPRELAKMIEEDTEEEEEKASVLGQLASLPGLDLGSIKDKAQATLGDLKQSAEKCCIM
uniref:Complexin 3 n=1 Tax=Oryctolagus cuniculus TaxID=9986 RepID=G1TYR2_RABIT